MGGNANQPADGVDRTLPYQSIRHVPKHNRIGAIVSMATGVVSACLAAAFGFAAGAAWFEGGYDAVAAAAAFFALCFLFCACMLFRQANEQWGWVG